MKISFITTVLNEEKNIENFLSSVIDQSHKPDEIIIVDGGSTDNTLSVISNFKFPISKKNVKIITKKGNRSVGRNEAIKQSTGDIIVCSDAGCILNKEWIRSITAPFKNPEIDVVAGYYKGKAKNSFEKCIIPYFLVMEDRINSNNFLPATRSMAFRKEVWKKIGGFDEGFSHNEDYVFAKNVRKNGAKIVFQKKAIVYWLPKKNLGEAFMTFYRFALGDAEARIFRPKVIFIFLRYFLAIILFILFIVTKFTLLLNILLILIAVYILWSIIKNFRYVKDPAAFYYLPIIQITSDVAVILGTTRSLFVFEFKNE